MKRIIFLIFILFFHLYALDNNDTNKTKKENEYYYLQIYIKKAKKTTNLNQFNSTSSFQTNSLGEAALVMGLSAVFNYENVLNEVKKYELPHYHKKLQNDFTFMQMIDAQEEKEKEKYKVEIYHY